MDEILQDKRFAHVVRDPRFHRMARNQRKVKIDKRFKDMFTDKRFKLKYSVDKRGRPVKLTSNENLKKYYELDEASSDDEDASEDEDDDADAVGKSAVKYSENDEDSEADESESGSDKECDTDSEASDEEEQKSAAALTNIKDPRFKISEMKSLKGEKVKNKKQKEVQKRQEKESKADLAKMKKRGKSVLETEKLNQMSKADRRHAKPDGALVSTVTDSSSESEDEGETDKDEYDEDVDNDEEEKDEVDDEEESDAEEQEASGGGLDLARGEGNMDSSSSEEDTDDEIEDVIGMGTSSTSEFDHRWGELDEEADVLQEATSRLAVCNMDWDRIKAKDIFVLLNSFKPAKGVITSVKVYKSEFGKARMEEEQIQGPRELKQMKDERRDGSDEETQDTIGTKYNTEKLREYQLNRLKYFYAVIECDSKVTADEIYKECDGLEYETSSTKMDLRFIPDDMEFEDDPETVCTSVPPDYKPSLFINTALSQSKVELTWDETDRERVQRTAQQFSGKAQDLKEDDLKAYLASSSDEEGPNYGALVDQSDDDDDKEGGDGAESEDKQINKYKMLLQEIDQGEKEKKKNDVQMEITWEPGLKETTEGLLKKKEQKGLTPWEEYLEKKKEKKRKKREERNKKKVEDLLDSDQEDVDPDTTDAVNVEVDEGGQAFSDDEIPTGVDFDDPFFSELQTNKKSGKEKKKKKKKKDEKAPDEDASSEKAALSLLVMDEDDNREHFNLKNLVQAEKKKKKKKKKQQDEDEEEEVTQQVDNFQLNVKDSRFNAIYESHLFNLDPSAPEYKKTKGTEAIIEEKLKRRRNSEKRKESSDGKRSDSAKKQKFEADIEHVKVKDDSLASLVNSVKVKTQKFQSKKIKR